jgi:hypothetical protein
MLLVGVVLVAASTEVLGQRLNSVLINSAGAGCKCGTATSDMDTQDGDMGG